MIAPRRGRRRRRRADVSDALDKPTGKNAEGAAAAALLEEEMHRGGATPRRWGPPGARPSRSRP